MHSYGYRYVSFPHSNVFFKICTIENTNFNNSLKRAVTRWRNRLCKLRYCSCSSGQATSWKLTRMRKFFPLFFCLDMLTCSVARHVQYPELTVKFRNYLTSSRHATLTKLFTSQSAPTSKPSPNPCVTVEAPFVLAFSRGSGSSELEDHTESCWNFEDEPQGRSSPVTFIALD